jgi:hypothetical protein
MRLLANSEAQAQEYCDRAYAYLQQDNPAYAAHMERWATPVQDEDGQWGMAIESSVMGAFSEAELERLDPPIESE